jgi:extradiol dioxygenase
MGLSLRFLHCNPRHHTVALATVHGMVGVHHLMLEVNDVDDVGRTLDLVNAHAIPVAMGLGRHTNDFMTSFYVRTPSGFEIEYGAGGRVIDDDNWEIETYDAMSIWGHKPPADPLFPGMLHAFAPAGACS